MIDTLIVMILDALETDGKDHKQWFLHRIADVVGIDKKELILFDEGTPP